MIPRLAALALALCILASPALAAEKYAVTAKGAKIYTYDSPTDQDQVSATIRKEVLERKQTVLIKVITGTHGADDGTVDPKFEEKAFKYEDRATGNVTSKNISVRDYHKLAKNVWNTDINASGENVVIVLAWCYSDQWLYNKTAAGNDGRITLKAAPAGK